MPMNIFCEERTLKIFISKLFVSLNMTILLQIIVYCLISLIFIKILIIPMRRNVHSLNDEKNKIQQNNVKRNLKEIWNIEPGNFWIPLDGIITKNTCYFKIDEFNVNFGLINLSELINKLENGKFYSFSELNEFSQIDSLNIDKYPGVDTYYSNYNADWVVYITHENTITFGGSMLINAIKSKWDEMDKFKNP
jgi:hypothetical protein